MKVNKTTAGVLVVFVLGIAALAAWGEQLGMSPEALTWVQTAAGVIGATVLSMLPRLLADKDGDGIPDIVEKSGPLLLALCLGAGVLTGCGAQLSDSARAALAVRTQQCLIAERAIVDDPCGDLSPEACEARDTAALAASRAQCDADRAAIVGN